MPDDRLTEDMVIQLLRGWRPNDVSERMKLADYHHRTMAKGMTLPEPWGSAPHEVNAVLRMHRAGFDGIAIQNKLKMRASQVIGLLQTAMSEERSAHHRNVPIHDAPIRK